MTRTASVPLPYIEHIANNFTSVRIDHVDIWFSYQTMIAFKFPGMNRIVSENVHGTTTGKHIGKLCDEKARVPFAAFHAIYKDAKAGILHDMIGGDDPAGCEVIQARVQQIIEDSE